MIKKIVVIIGILTFFINCSVCFAKNDEDKKPPKKVKDEAITTQQFHDATFDLTPVKREELKKIYKDVTKEDRIYVALELMKDTIGSFSRKAIMGENLTTKPIKVEFKDLSSFGQQYAEFDALGWKKGKTLYIYINQQHWDAPPPALAAILSHEALHQDEFNSINEETYAWTMEASVWFELSEQFPKVASEVHPLVMRENMLKRLFIRGNYTDKYIRKTVASNPGYQNLPSRSPGFEEENL